MLHSILRKTGDNLDLLDLNQDESFWIIQEKLREYLWLNNFVEAREFHNEFVRAGCRKKDSYSVSIIELNTLNRTSTYSFICLTDIS